MTKRVGEALSWTAERSHRVGPSIGGAFRSTEIPHSVIVLLGTFLLHRRVPPRSPSTARHGRAS